MSIDDRRILIAWILDRAAQYNHSSATRAAFDELIDGIRNDEPERAYRCGELDDLLGNIPRTLPRSG